MCKTRLPERPIKKGPIAAKGPALLKLSIALAARAHRLHLGTWHPVAALNHHNRAHRRTFQLILPGE